jgi:hypothetical protein
MFCVYREVRVYQVYRVSYRIMRVSYRIVRESYRIMRVSYPILRVSYRIVYHVKNNVAGTVVRKIHHRKLCKNLNKKCLINDKVTFFFHKRDPNEPIH